MPSVKAFSKRPGAEASVGGLKDAVASSDARWARQADARIARIRQKITAFDWTTIAPGKMVFAHDRGAKFGADFPATVYAIVDGVRSAAELTLRYTDKTEKQALVVAASEIVTTDDVRDDSVLVGERITNIARSQP